MSKESTIDAAKLKTLKKEISDALAVNRYTLLAKFPFTGNISLHMNLIPVRDVRVRTACTDGNNIYFDMDFYLSLEKKERIFVLAHEIWHCVMMHLVRLQTRDQYIFNFATDMEVNYILREQGLIPPENLLFPPSNLEGSSAETIYEWLLKQDKNKSSSGKGKIDSSMFSSNGSNENDGDDEDDGDNNSYSNSSSSSNAKKRKDGKDTGKLEGQFDNHKYDNEAEDVINKPEDLGIKDRWGSVGFDSDFKPKISKDFSEKMREAIISEAQRVQRTQGSIPSAVESFLKKIMKPEIHWTEVLAQFVTSCYNGKRRWLPPSRRHIYNEIYLQSRRNEKLKVTVAIDTSGSCVEDLPKFFSELISLLKSFGEYELNLIQCDAEVSKFDKYDAGKPFDVDNIDNIKWAGGGGTSFKPPFEYVRTHALEQDCFIYLTDGYGDAPTYPPPYPVLWVLTKDGSDDFCSWGKKMKFKKDYDV